MRFPGFELDSKGTNVLGVVATLNVDGHLRSLSDMADVSALNITPPL